MALDTQFIKKTQHEAIVKVYGTGGPAIIELPDLVAPRESVEGIPTVNIAGFTFTGTNDCVITVSRGDSVIASVSPTGANYMDFRGQDMVPEITNNVFDITINISGTQGQLWLKLKKVSGYSMADFSDYTRWDAGLYWDSITLLWE